MILFRDNDPQQSHYELHQLRKDHEALIHENKALLHVIWQLVKRLGNRVELDPVETLATVKEWELTTTKDPLTNNLIVEAKDRKKE